MRNVACQEGLPLPISNSSYSGGEKGPARFAFFITRAFELYLSGCHKEGIDIEYKTPANTVC